METIRQQLVESEVIEGIVDDFLPRKEFILTFEKQEIRLGDQISTADMQSKPGFDYDYNENDENDPELKEVLENSTYVFVMTQLDDTGREYLHWIQLTGFLDAEYIHSRDESLVSYEPPKPMGIRRKMVFAYFDDRNASQPITAPTSRENFSTRVFAQTYGLGPPLAAGFFYIKSERMELIRQQLVGSGVIGGVVDNFLPRKEFFLLFSHQHIRLGDQISPAHMQHEPYFNYYYYENEEDDPELKEVFENFTYVFVMTDLDASGREYLHWVYLTGFLPGEQIDLEGKRVVPYEPPRPCIGIERKMVFTIFDKRKVSQPIVQPTSRENFSTRNFAQTYGLGPPLAAGFFYVGMRTIDNEASTFIPAWTKWITGRSISNVNK